MSAKIAEPVEGAFFERIIFRMFGAAKEKKCEALPALKENEEMIEVEQLDPAASFKRSELSETQEERTLDVDTIRIPGELPAKKLPDIVMRIEPLDDETFPIRVTITPKSKKRTRIRLFDCKPNVTTTESPCSKYVLLSDPELSLHRISLLDIHAEDWHEVPPGIPTWLKCLRPTRKLPVLSISHKPCPNIVKVEEPDNGPL